VPMFFVCCAGFREGGVCIFEQPNGGRASLLAALYSRFGSALSHRAGRVRCRC
jgi:hypothetical protein